MVLSFSCKKNSGSEVGQTIDEKSSHIIEFIKEGKRAFVAGLGGTIDYNALDVKIEKITPDGMVIFSYNSVSAGCCGSLVTYSSKTYEGFNLRYIKTWSGMNQLDLNKENARIYSSVFGGNGIYLQRLRFGGFLFPPNNSLYQPKWINGYINGGLGTWTTPGNTPIYPQYPPIPSGISYQFEETNSSGKDLELMGAKLEFNEADYLKENLISRYGFSEQRAFEVAKLTYNFQKIQNKRSLTEKDMDIFTNKAFGVDSAKGLKAIKELAQGDNQNFEEIVESASTLNETSPEAMRELIEDYLIK